MTEAERQKRDKRVAALLGVDVPSGGFQGCAGEDPYTLGPFIDLICSHCTARLVTLVGSVSHAIYLKRGWTNCPVHARLDKGIKISRCDTCGQEVRQ